MPKRLMLVLAVFASVLAACSTAAPNFGAPTPTSTASSTPNPNITQTTVTAVYQTIPRAGVTVCESAGASGGCYSRGATPIATVTTDYLGHAVFTNLTPGTVYCWEAVYNGTILNNCTSNWQGSGGVQVGT